MFKGLLKFKDRFIISLVFVSLLTIVWAYEFLIQEGYKSINYIILIISNSMIYVTITYIHDLIKVLSLGFYNKNYRLVLSSLYIIYSCLFFYMGIRYSHIAFILLFIATYEYIKINEKLRLTKSKILV